MHKNKIWAKLNQLFLKRRVFNISVNPRDSRIVTIASPSDPKKANISVNQDGTLSNEGKAREFKTNNLF